MRVSADRRAWFAVAFVAGLFSPPPAAAAAKPDLVQKAVSDPPAEVAAGESLEIEDQVRNRGRSSASPSRTGFYLSADGRRDASDTGLRGKRSVPRLSPGDRSTGSTTVEVPVTAPLGSRRLIACADDRGGVREGGERNNCVASDARVRVALPATCQGRLTRRGIRYSIGPFQPGVADPVTIRVPLSGIAYVAVGEAVPQSSLFVDCTLALALHRMAETLRPLGIDTVEHFGVYNYRCIAGTDPCELSEHAHATAIDLHEFRTDTGDTYNVETDWVIDSGPAATCSAPTSGPKDALLHRLACEWDATGLFHIILTPNYNADHRNHFHVDLTPGADFID